MGCAVGRYVDDPDVRDGNHLSGFSTRTEGESCAGARMTLVSGSDSHSHRDSGQWTVALVGIVTVTIDTEEEQ